MNKEVYQLALDAINSNNQELLKQFLPGLFPNLNFAKIGSQANLYHGITPRDKSFSGDEMPLPSQMISPKKYVSLLEKILSGGIKGFHSTGHYLHLNEDFPTIYNSASIRGSHAHMGVYFKPEKHTGLYTLPSVDEVVIIAKNYLPKNIGVYVKSFDYCSANYDGGRSSFDNLSSDEQDKLEAHIKNTILELKNRGIDYQIMDLGENCLIDSDEYEEKLNE